MPVPKPEAGESKEDYIAKCEKFLHDENKMRDEKRPNDQISAICFEQWREYARGHGFDGESIPILRSFEKDGKKYVYGYAAIFNTPDAFGTVMTRQVVDSSIPHLTKFPATRFMHRDPFAQIVFNRQVDGFGTFVDEHGFHVLCEVYDHKENEWNMVQRGGWGFSFGFMPNPNSSGFEERKTPDGRMLPHFANGLIYEVSVVDTPAHEDAVAYAIRRGIDSHKGGNVMTKEKQKYVAVGDVDEKLGTGGYACKVGDEWKLPIHDAAHCRNAMARYNQAEGCQTPEVKARICSAAKHFGIDNAFEKGGFCYTGEERKMEKKEIEEMEQRITDAVTAKINEKKTTTDFATSLKEMEQRIMKAMETKIAESFPEKQVSEMESTFEGVKTRVSGIDVKIEALKKTQKEFKQLGENVDSITERIGQLETERAELEKTVVTSVTDAVERKMRSYNERLEAIENTPELRSPATHSEKVQRGLEIGFAAMLDAATEGRD